MKLKRLISILIIIVMMMGVGGCMKESPDAVKQDLLNYIEKKYGEKFVIINYGLEDGYANIQFDHIVVHPQNDKEQVFMAYREKKSNGSGYEYHDGYAYRLAEPLMDERIKSIVGNEFSNLKFAAHISNGHLEYTAHNYKKGNINLDEFLKSEAKDASCVLEIDVAMDYDGALDKNKICEQIYNFTKKLINSRVVKNKICVNVYSYIFDDKNFNKANPRNLYRDNLQGDDITDIYHARGAVIIGSEDGLNYNDTVQDVLKSYREN